MQSTRRSHNGSEGPDGIEFITTAMNEPIGICFPPANRTTSVGQEEVVSPAVLTKQQLPDLDIFTSRLAYRPYPPVASEEFQYSAN
jgi:hypothetical protein